MKPMFEHCKTLRAERQSVRMARAQPRVDALVTGEEMAAMTSVALSVAAVACVVQVLAMRAAMVDVVVQIVAATKAIRQGRITAIPRAQPHQVKVVVAVATVVIQAAILLMVTALTMTDYQAASILNAR